MGRLSAKGEVVAYQARALPISENKFCPHLIIRYGGGEVAQESLREWSHVTESDAIAFGHQYMRDVLLREARCIEKAR